MASLAVLADEDSNWRPIEIWTRLFGCETGIRFPVVKLLGFAPHEAALEADANPFAKIVLAHLKRSNTGRSGRTEKRGKTSLGSRPIRTGFQFQGCASCFDLSTG